MPVSVGTWGPFVFANPDPDAEPLGRRARRSPGGRRRARSRRRVACAFTAASHYEIRANWKIALENYLECYHCPVNHPGLVQVIDERRAASSRPTGCATSQFAPVHPRSLEGNGPIDASGEVGAAQNHLWFPTLKFNVLPGHPNLSIGPLWPTGPDTLRGVPRLLVRPTAPTRAGSRSCSRSTTQIGAEDTALVEAAQRGSAGGG